MNLIKNEIDLTEEKDNLHELKSSIVSDSVIIGHSSHNPKRKSKLFYLHPINTIHVNVGKIRTNNKATQPATLKVGKFYALRQLRQCEMIDASEWQTFALLITLE